ncbi:MAG TPA: NAD-binding protein [Vicinamibacteria bacterium]|nr:NAD-binding protein [Vicinamibacteria bacterium]
MPNETSSSGEERRSQRRVLIVGAGQTGRELARILSENWDIAVLDVDERRLERLRREHPKRGNVRLFPTDGTSLLNLKEAGLESSEWLVAVTNRDEINAEACRVARSIGNPPTVIAALRRPEHREWLTDVEAEVVSRPGAVAGLIKNRIERAHQVASGVGLGQGEIIEIPVLRSSPAVDVRVRDLRARRWLVAAIYREDRYVVPHGHVVLREGDRLLLTGEPEILPHIADYLRAGVARFPLQYGTRIVAFAPKEQSPSFWEEVQYVFEHTRSRSARALTPKDSLPPELKLARGKLETQVVNASDDLRTIVRREVPGLDCGCFVLPKDRAGFLVRAGLNRPDFARSLDTIACPMLLAAGSHPYRRILLPILDPDASILAAELAIDLSRQLEVEVAAVMVVPPAFIVGQEAVEEQKDAMRTVMEVGSLYHRKIEKIQREGNPAKEIALVAGEGDLLVLSHRAGRKSSFFNPDTGLQIIVRCPSSVLALSYGERVHGTG